MIEQLLLEVKMTYADVTIGKMMSQEALVKNGKVFCFEYKEQMVFKLGKDFDFQPYDIKSFEYLNPFKNKGPMLAWYIIDKSYEKCFYDLALIAYEKLS